MGASCSSGNVPSTFSKKENIKLIAIAGELGMSQIDLKNLYKQFYKADIIRDNNLSISEFAVMHRFENEAFASLLFSVFDFDNSGVVNFEEFVIALWTSLTLDDADLMGFTFRLFDKDNSGYLSNHELVKMLSIVCGKDAKGQELAQRFLKQSDKNDDGIVSYSEFVDMTKRSALLLFPAFEMRNKLRDTILGASRWKALAKRRQTLYPQMSLEDIMKVMKNKPTGYKPEQDRAEEYGELEESTQKMMNAQVEKVVKKKDGPRNSFDKGINRVAIEPSAGGSAPSTRTGTTESERDRSRERDRRPENWHEESTRRRLSISKSPSVDSSGRTSRYTSPHPSQCPCPHRRISGDYAPFGAVRRRTNSRTPSPARHPSAPPLEDSPPAVKQALHGVVDATATGATAGDKDGRRRHADSPVKSNIVLEDISVPEDDSEDTFDVTEKHVIRRKKRTRRCTYEDYQNKHNEMKHKPHSTTPTFEEYEQLARANGVATSHRVTFEEYDKLRGEGKLGGMSKDQVTVTAAATPPVSSTVSSGETAGGFMPTDLAVIKEIDTRVVVSRRRRQLRRDRSTL